MVKRKMHKKRTTHRVVRGGARRAFQKKAGEIALNALHAGGGYAKKHVTKENIKKAIAESKKATSYLKTLLHKKKKEPQRVTMTLFRK